MFDRFKSGEQEQYLFLQLPIMLIKDNTFKELSSDAKILYSLLLNRTSLSAKNGWIDDEGYIYIIYTIDQIMEDLNCWEKRATKAMKELRDIGLVESIRRGLGKPNILYVTNFATELKYQKPYKAKAIKTPITPLNCQNDNSRIVETTNQELSKEQFKNCQNDNVVILTKSNNDFSNKESESTSESAKTEKVTHSHENENDIDNDIEFIKSNEPVKKEKEPPISNTDQSTETESPLSKHISNAKLSDYDYTTYRLKLQENIDYSHYLTYQRADIDLINELIDCMLDVICTHGETVKIGKENKPRQMVIAQYLKINSIDIDHVLDRYKEQRHKITHLHAYLKTMLYTVKQENGFYYTNAVRVDGVI